MDEGISQPVTCRVFREELFRFQSDEMSDPDRAALQDHLNSCRDCADRLELEDLLLVSIKEALPRVPAPEGLESRIRQALSQVEPEQPGGRVVPIGRAWWKDPVVAALAAVFLLAALITPVVMNRNLAPSPAVFTGTIVDYECDQNGLPLEMQRQCTERSHLNALKLDNGEYVHFNSHHGEYRELVSDLDVRGSRVTIHGTLHPEIRTLEITGVDTLSGRL